MDAIAGFSKSYVASDGRGILFNQMFKIEAAK
jgi:hypothetical protein